MSVDDAQMLKILEHEGSPPFNKLGILMPLARLRAMYRYDESLETLKKCREQLNALLWEFGAAYTEEYRWLISL